MIGPKTTTVIAFLLLCFFFALTSCGPSGPAAGTPGFYWQAAKETFATHDYLKTADHLERVTRTDNEFTQQALPFRLVVTAGLAKAHMDLAGYIDSGIKARKDAALPPASFRTRASYRALAERWALEFGDAYLRFEKSSREPNVVLEFAHPGTGMAPLPEVARIKDGGLLPETVMAALARRMIEQAVASKTGDAVGASGDPAKAQALFQSGRAQVPRDVFVFALANHLYDQAQLFDRSRLDKSDRLQFFCQKGLDALKSIKESEGSKELADKLQFVLKSGKV
jgi:hypothetical protein